MTASMPMSMTVSFCSPLNLNGSHLHIISHSSSQKIASHHTYSVTLTKELKWSPHTIITGMQSRTRLRAASSDNNAEDNKEPASISDTSRDDLAAKLAAAEAEAEALRRELAERKGNRDIDLSKLKPAIPEKRIDGVGYRETIFSAPGKAMEVEQPSKWGLSEAELFLSKGAPSERTQIGSSPIEDNSKEIVARRLLIGSGLALSAIGLAYFKLPAGLVKPSKPLFVYVIPILQLREQLMTIENFASDVNLVRFQLKKINDSDDFSKDTFLSAAGYLEGADRDTASSITYSIFDYLNQASNGDPGVVRSSKDKGDLLQPSIDKDGLLWTNVDKGDLFSNPVFQGEADYNKYFDYMGQPPVSQQLDFLKFSLKSIQAAREQIDKFLSLIPQEELQAAKSQIMRNMD
ncbi:uncharacterized protein LOC131031204 isoform X2 [Cryptomeria japonica]|uniref:uncharacterized protein LOC131031204 isoform X2 n=1 Tax=Cryptomeria japonica TaxID=3369 RepID=UPI0027DA6F3F|nr:uncharacterized protein LOC131031204 isoform X2 [Cryptomeria japonica]